MKTIRIVSYISPFAVALTAAGNVMAQTKNDFLLGASTSSATTSSLPNAGSTGLTYIIFTLGLTLFAVGTLKLLLSFKN